MFSIENTIQSLPSLSVIDLRSFELPIKRYVMGGIANIAYAYVRKCCSLSNSTVYFFMTLCY